MSLYLLHIILDFPHSINVCLYFFFLFLHMKDSIIRISLYKYIDMIFVNTFFRFYHIFPGTIKIILQVSYPFYITTFQNVGFYFDGITRCVPVSVWCSAADLTAETAARNITSRWSLTVRRKKDPSRDKRSLQATRAVENDSARPRCARVWFSFGTPG